MRRFHSKLYPLLGAVAASAALGMAGTGVQAQDGTPVAGSPAAAHAVARLSSTGNGTVSGTVRFETDGGTMTIAGNISGLEAGPHGLHLHENGDCSSPDASSAGDHWSPDDDPHGAPDDPDAGHHLGDLGNIVANEQGDAEFTIVDREMTLTTAPDAVVGRAVIVHAGEDDLVSQPSGDAGDPVACGVIEPAP